MTRSICDGPLLSHPERCLANGGDRVGLTVDLHRSHGLTSEEAQQELPRQSDKPDRRITATRSHSLARSSPLEFESHAA